MSEARSARCTKETRKGQPCALSYRHGGPCRPSRNDNTMVVTPAGFAGVDPLARIVDAPRNKPGVTR